MLNVGELNEGFVLDHIEAGKAMMIYNYLGLDKLDCQVAIIKNARSGKMGKKDIIKIEGGLDLVDLDVLGFVDHNITVNIIKNGEIVETNDIDAFKKDIKNNCYILEVEDSSVIGSIIDYKMDILTETEVRVYIEKEKVPLLIKELVLRNVKIYNVSEENLSLEDAFLKKTGGNVIE